MSKNHEKQLDIEVRCSELEQLNGDLQLRLQRAKAKTDALVAATFEGSKAAHLALGPIPPVPKPDLKGGHRKGEVALLHLTDWQGGKRTLTYSSDVMQARVLHYMDVAIQLTAKERSTHAVDDCVILFGGDLIEGLFNYPHQAWEVDASLFGQEARSARLVVEVIRRALSVFGHVHVVGEWGNHGRIGEKRSGVPAPDNIDRKIYESARWVLSEDKSTHGRLSWQVGPEHSQPIEVGNYRAVLLHGDEFGRTGNVARKTLVNKIVNWKSGAYKVAGKHWPFQDAYVGHYHTHAEEPLPDGVGAVYWTGSPESGNEYAHDTMAVGSMPTQRLHFIDPERGRVGPQYKIWLPER